MRFMKSLFLATSMFALIGGGATVQAASASAAQGESSTPATTEKAAESRNLLEEIVVTAQRRSESLQRTAASVSVRTGGDLQAAGPGEEERYLARAEDIGQRRHDDRQQHVKRLVLDEKV